MPTKSKSTAGKKKQVLKDFASRLNKACDDMGIPPKNRGRQSKLAELVGRSQKATRRWLEGEGMPAEEDRPTVSRAVRKREAWLYFGLGPESRDIDIVDEDRELLKKIMNAVDFAFDQEGIKIPADKKNNLSLSIYDHLRQT